MSNKNLKNKILLGSSIDIIGTLIAAIFSFILVKLYFNVLTREEYGIWLAINGLASLISLIDIGVDQYFITLIANEKHFYDKSFRNELSNTIFIKFIVVIIFTTIGIILLHFLPFIVNIPSRYLIIAKTTFTINVLYFVLNIFFNSANTILIGRNHFSFVNSITVLSTIGSGLLTYLLLINGLKILSFPLSLLIFGVLQFIIFFIYIKKRYPHICLGKINLSRKSGMINYSFSFQILKWAYLIRTQFIIVAINNLAGPVFATIYNITNKIPSMIPVYFSKIVLPFFPSFSSKIADNDFDYVNKMVIKLFKIVFRFSIFLSVCVFLYNKDFIRLWIGINNYGGNIINFWLVFYMFISASFSGFGIIIYATKKFEKWTILSLVEIFIVITLSYFLNKFFNFPGLIAGFAIGSVFTQFYVAIISLRQLGLDYKYLISQVYKFSLIPNIISLFFAFLFHKFFIINSLFDLIFQVCVFVLLHFLFYDFTLIFFKKRDIIKFYKHFIKPKEC